MEENEIKGVLDDFEADNFVDAQDKLQKIVRTARDEFIQNKLGLKNPLTTPEVVKVEDNVDIDINNNYSIPSFYTLNTMIGLKWKWGEWDLYLNNITDQKYLSSGMMSTDAIGNPLPLYYVSSPINFFTAIKFKIK